MATTGMLGGVVWSLQMNKYELSICLYLYTCSSFKLVYTCSACDALVFQSTYSEYSACTSYI